MGVLQACVSSFFLKIGPLGVIPWMPFMLEVGIYLYRSLATKFYLEARAMFISIVTE
jgi:hypothetical protein